MHKKEKNITYYSYNSEIGDAEVFVYHLFPGVDVAYTSVHMADFDFEQTRKGESKNFVTIHFCKEGRIEQEMNREFVNLMPGDCSISICEKEKSMFQLPLKHYHGISIGINLETKDNPLLIYLDSCGYPLQEIMNHICGGMSQGILRSSDKIQSFFNELYDIPSDQRLDFLRVKLPELFLMMKYADVDSSNDRNLIPRSQVDFVKSVSDYISRNLNETITVRRLSQKFSVSATYLQNAFRSVYGMPVISFIRVQKMQCAAQVLIRTNRTIDEIAEEFGYENESKFSAAFKKIMGDPPGVYRKEHSKIKIL